MWYPCVGNNKRSRGAPCFGKGQGKLASNAAEARSNYIISLGPDWRGSFNRHYPFCLLFVDDAAYARPAPARNSSLANRRSIAGCDIRLPAYGSSAKIAGVSHGAIKYVPDSLSFSGSIYGDSSQDDPNTRPIWTNCHEVDSPASDAVWKIMEMPPPCAVEFHACGYGLLPFSFLSPKALRIS